MSDEKCPNCGSTLLTICHCCEQPWCPSCDRYAPYCECCGSTEAVYENPRGTKLGNFVCERCLDDEAQKMEELP